MKINVCADGGGTKLDILAFDGGGRLLFSGAGGGTNTNFENHSIVEKNMLEAISGCFHGGRYEIHNLYHTIVGPSDLFVGLLSGAVGKPENVYPLGEGYAYHLAGALCETGGTALSGTGSGAIWCESRDRIVHAGGFGFPIGDGGSGSWIGLRASELALRSLEGWEIPSELTWMLGEYLGVSPDRAGFIKAFYSDGKMTRTVISGFARIVARAANAGDALALSVEREAGELMARHMDCVCAGKTGTVTACGGAWKGSSAMFDSFRVKMNEKYPDIVCCRALFDPVAAGVVRYFIDAEGVISESRREMLVNEFSGYLTDGAVK